MNGSLIAVVGDDGQDVGRAATVPAAEASLPFEVAEASSAEVIDHVGPIDHAGGRDPDGRGVAGLARVPGPDLAELLSRVGLDSLDDDGLLDAAAAWHRLGAWAKAGELAVVDAFLERRRPEVRGDAVAADATTAEVQLVLGRMTNAALSRLLLLAEALHGPLPGTRAALAAGIIDEQKAHIIAWKSCALDDDAAGRVERRVLPRAGEWSTGQLRAAVERAVLEVDPAGAEHRRREAETRRHVELRNDDDHTASLAGRNLPAAVAVAADNRINAIAVALKADGDSRSLSQVRADVFAQLLLGNCPTPSAGPTPKSGDQQPSSSPPNAAVNAGVTTAIHVTVTIDDVRRARDQQRQRREIPAPTSPPGPTTVTRSMPNAPPSGVSSADAARSGGTTGGPSPRCSRPVSGEVRVITPLATLTGEADRPGEIGGLGPVTAASVRAMAGSAVPRRWCYSVLDADGRAVHHGHLSPREGSRIDHDDLLDAIAGEAGDGWDELGCSGRHHLAGGGAYQVRGRLRHQIEVRDRTCRFPTCRRPATQCDIDHTTPWHADGSSCECNLSPLCRRHHQTKQAPGWKLTQPRPGRLVWTTATGRTFHCEPDTYPG